MRVDRLTIDAVVNDKFKDTLDKLAEQLRDVATAQKAVKENQTIGVDVDGIRELKKLNRELAKNNTLSATSNTIAANAPTTTVSPDGGGSSGGGSTTTADGGTTNTSSLRNIIKKAQENFGKAFDGTALANNADRVQRQTDLLDGDPADYIDTQAMAQSILDGDLSQKVAKNIQSDNESKQSGAFRTLRKMGLTSLPTREGGVFSKFQDVIENFDATALNNLRASLFPLLATFIGALPAAIAGIVALGGAAMAVAAALGAVGAMGALGVVVAEDESLSDLATDLKQSFLESFAPIGEALRPTFMEGIDSLDEFFANLADKAGMLRGLTEETLDFQESLEAYALGGFENIIGLAEASTGIFADLSEEMEGLTITGAIAGMLMEFYHPLLFAIKGVASLIPLILHLSKGFLYAVGIITSIVGIFAKLANMVPYAATALGGFLAILFTAISVTLLWSAATRLLTTELIGLSSGGIWSTVKAIPAYISGMSAGTVVTWGMVYAVLKLTAALIGLTLGLFAIGAAASYAATEWLGLGDGIRSARKEMKKFQRASSGAGNVGNFMQSTNGRSSGQYRNYNDNRQTTIVAPDKETGSKISSKHEYTQDVANQHTT